MKVQRSFRSFKKFICCSGGKSMESPERFRGRRNSISQGLPGSNDSGDLPRYLKIWEPDHEEPSRYVDIQVERGRRFQRSVIYRVEDVSALYFSLFPLLLSLERLRPRR